MPGYMPRAQRSDWMTPPALFDALVREFGPFDLDPCGDPDSYVSQHCAEFWTEGSLEKLWHGKVFANPPHGREMGKWVQKCSEEVRLGSTKLVVALLPVRTDVRWWQKYICTGTGWVWADEVRFIAGRVKFVGAQASAPFPSAIVVWRK